MLPAKGMPLFLLNQVWNKKATLPISKATDTARILPMILQTSTEAKADTKPKLYICGVVPKMTIEDIPTSCMNANLLFYECISPKQFIRDMQTYKNQV